MSRGLFFAVLALSSASVGACLARGHRATLVLASAAWLAYAVYEAGVPRGTNIRADLVLALPLLLAALLAGLVSARRLARKPR